MPPAKRSRPAFSPPRPGKGKTTAVAKTSAAADGVTRAKPKGAISKARSSKATTPSKTKPKAAATNPRRRSRLVSPTPSASDSLDGESEHGNEPMDVDDNDDGDDDGEDDTAIANRDAEDSPEPDYILAEVTHETASSSRDPPIPPGLVHRILHSQFAEPEKTKISTDAREVVTRYIEVFVREAIMRCAYEKTGEGADGVNAEKTDGGGWLEVEDLEKVAVQLCLDF